MNWFIQPPDLDGRSRLTAAFGIEPVTAQILVNRGLKDIEEARRFLDPVLSDLPDPFFLPDMDLAVEKIAAAIKNKERIALYGDYDVDGISGVAILTRFFRSIGHEPLVFIPNRLAEGYGLHSAAIDSLKERGASLIITVDCGTRSTEAIEYCKRNGLDIIITDHHEVDKIPDDHILLNPKRPDIISPHKEIAGCGVAFFLLMALKQKLSQEKSDIKEHLDLVALGTIADVVPLIGVNRIFAKFGMEMARTSTKQGLRSLIGVSGLDGAPLKTGSVAFRLAPRINAAGRMGDALPSLELLTTDDIQAAGEIARMLNSLNADRQRIEEKALGEAIENIERDCLHKRSALVVADERWHAGVIGIVASKLVDRYLLPSVVITSAQKKSKGSARSISGLNIIDALESCSDLLLRFGGHSQAAGLVVDEEKIDAFRVRFEDVCARHLPTTEKPLLTIDALVEPKDISTKLAKEIERLEPFGLGNPEPILCTQNLKVTGKRIVGRNHLKLRLGTFDAIGFDMGSRPIEVGESVDVAFTPQMNTWNGLTSLQLKIKGIACSK